jgi:hypothetical protein
LLNREFMRFMLEQPPITYYYLVIFLTNKINKILLLILNDKKQHTIQ